MNLFFLLFFLFRKLISVNNQNLLSLKEMFLYKNIEQNLENPNGIRAALKYYLKSFPQYDEDSFNLL